MGMNSKIKYEFSTKMWQHDSPGGWHFTALPKAISKEIRNTLNGRKKVGRMKAIAQIKQCQWKTAIWFDSKTDTYILPIKS